MKQTLLLLLLSILPLGLHAQETLSILSYNILEGLRGDTAVEQGYVDWVSDLSPDIIAYQEMNGFTQRKLEALAMRYGHPYAVLSKTEGYPVAVTSKYPIVSVEKVVDNMWHAYIYARINGVHVFVVHFSPHQYEKRRHEVREILARAALIPEGEPIAIMGDFNSLSKDDEEHYDEAFLEVKRSAEANRAHIRNLDNGMLDYSVTRAMKEAGFTDSLRVFEPRFQHTFPTKAFFKNVTQRIDYIWVNEAMAKKLVSAKVIYDEETEQISDHYPIFAEFDFQ